MGSVVACVKPTSLTRLRSWIKTRATVRAMSQSVSLLPATRPNLAMPLGISQALWLT
jgi:hypothetical protein